MKSPPARPSVFRWLPLVTIAFLGAGMGCGDESSVSPQPAETPRFVSARGDGLAPLHAGNGNGEDVRKTALISASKGGSFNAGRHRLTFPPGALDRDTWITIVDATNRVGYVECELYPEGIQFREPVMLETQFSDLESPNGCSMYWLANDADADVWMNVGGLLTNDGKGIVATLHHFSTYAPGKTGW